MSFISKLITVTLLIVNILLLVGCAKDPNVALKAEFWNEPSKKSIIVALDKSSKADMEFYGVGLLDFVIDKAAMHQFITYLNQYDLSNFNILQAEFADNLNQHRKIAEKYNNSIDLNKLQDSQETNYNIYERKYFKSLLVPLKNHPLLLLNINFIGASRHYYGIIPLGAPKAICNAEGRLVDLNNNKTIWRFSTEQVVMVDGDWDQPPHYPNFTHALNKAVSQANQAIIDDFFVHVSNVQIKN